MNSSPSYESFDDVEALVRSAGNYVRPSADLRPRVVETARSERSEQRAQRRLWQLAILLVAFGVLSPSLREGRSDVSAWLRVSAFDAASPAESSDATWGAVDSFTELRRRQAELLSL